jgi:hypothetical protein
MSDATNSNRLVTALRVGKKLLRRTSIAGLAGIALCAGCIPAPAPQPVTVELINQTGLDVTPNLYVSGDAGDSAALFGDDANRVTDFTDRPFPELRSGEIVSLEFPCKEAASIGVRNAVLFDAVTLTVTNSTDEIFLPRDGDYDCGATIRFYYFREGAAFRVRFE